MFEKEAEIYALSNFGFKGKNSQRVLTAKIDYQYGSEFGYTKAKKEMQELGLALQSDMDKTIEQNIQLKKQIEKMKCCENCAFEYPKTDGNSEICRRCRRYPKPFTEWQLDNGR